MTTKNGNSLSTTVILIDVVPMILGLLFTIGALIFTLVGI